MKSKFWSALVLSALTTTPAFAQSIDLFNGTEHSAFRDTSNMLISQLNYRTQLMTDSEEGERFLNQVVLTKDSNWDSNLTLDSVESSFDYYNVVTQQYETYTLGTAITPGSDWTFNAAFRSGDVDSNVADGLYNATLEFFGGDNEFASDLLASYNITLEVVQKLDISVEISASPELIGQGQTSQLLMTVTNNMSDANFVSDTWYVTNFTNGSSFLGLDNFNGNWFGQQIAPGDSRSDFHSTWIAASDQAAGLYTGTQGIVGGRYQGDFYFVRSNMPTSIGVIPGPGSLFVMGAGLLMGIPCLRLRRKGRLSA